MISRREAVTMIAALPASALPWSTPNFGRALSIAMPQGQFLPDRELMLTLSDQLRSQAWTYAGQRYIEHKSAIFVDENEQLRVTLMNDTPELRTVSFNNAQFALGPNSAATFDLFIDSLDEQILVDNANNQVRTIRVRPASLSHASMIA